MLFLHLLKSVHSTFGLDMDSLTYYLPEASLHFFFKWLCCYAGKDHLGKERAPLQELKEGIVFEQRKLSTQTLFLIVCALT
jgi:hypothetical protein